MRQRDQSARAVRAVRIAGAARGDARRADIARDGRRAAEAIRSSDAWKRVCGVPPPDCGSSAWRESKPQETVGRFAERDVRRIAAEQYPLLGRQARHRRHRRPLRGARNIEPAPAQLVLDILRRRFRAARPRHPEAQWRRNGQSATDGSARAPPHTRCSGARSCARPAPPDGASPCFAMARFIAWRAFPT